MPSWRPEMGVRTQTAVVVIFQLSLLPNNFLQSIV